MKELKLQAPKPLLGILCQIIRQYAEAAYPAGGSDCAQTARAGLMDTAERIEQKFDPVKELVVISRRIKSHIKAAIEYYIQLESEQGRAQEAQIIATMLLDCLNGQVISELQAQSVLIN